MLSDQEWTTVGKKGKKVKMSVIPTRAILAMREMYSWSECDHCDCIQQPYNPFPAYYEDQCECKIHRALLFLVEMNDSDASFVEYKLYFLNLINTEPEPCFGYRPISYQEKQAHFENLINDARVEDFHPFSSFRSIIHGFTKHLWSDGCRMLYGFYPAKNYTFDTTSDDVVRKNAIEQFNQKFIENLKLDSPHQYRYLKPY